MEEDRYYDRFGYYDRDRIRRQVNNFYDDIGKMRRVSTMNASKFDVKAKANYAVLSATAQNRTWMKTDKEAFEHADNLIDNGNADEFLIVKVVAVRRKKPVQKETIRVK